MRSPRTILITGGCGFIGTHLINHIINKTNYHIINIDKLTYAGSGNNLAHLDNHARYEFHQADICDAHAMRHIIAETQPDAIMNLAAETHVDRSIDSPADFLQTNIIGTYTLLEVARDYWDGKGQPNDFRFHHISTDEVYGDLSPDDPAFTETTAYDPHSPYSASKASSDHLVRAWNHTYGLPTLITNCSNNYGPYQFPEKLIPHMILNALNGQALPVYGDGQQVRDWLYADDHAAALLTVLEKGKIGETYNIGGQAEMTNIEVVTILCDILQDLRPLDNSHYHDLITYVTDRPGHDRRYAIDITKIQQELGWSPRHDFVQALRETVQWYLDQESWWRALLDKHYELQRIGTG